MADVEDNKQDKGNALKTVARTDDYLTVGNYIVLFGGRDLEGMEPFTTRVAWTNPDGSVGEYFTKSTDFESAYTKAGAFAVDWEHAQGEAADSVLGMVNWKSARVDDKGVFVERILQRKNRYIQWLEELGWFDDGSLGTSSQADPESIQKAMDGQITRWPLVRDTITVQPMEPRMLQGNQLQAFKALFPEPDDTAGEPEPEATPEAARAAVDAVKARLLRIRLSLLEE